MTDNRTTTGTRWAKLALTLVGVISCTGGAAYALALVGSSPASKVDVPVATAGKDSRSLSIQVTPAISSVAPGEIAEYAIRIRRGKRRQPGVGERQPRLFTRDRVRLSLPDGVPRGATASLTPRLSFRRRATLRISTAGVQSGSHQLRLLARSGNHRASATVRLIVGSPQTGNANFAISGDLSSPLEPGLAVPLDLALTNSGPDQITVSSLEVSVTSVSAPRATPTYPCTLLDFSVIPFSGVYGFVVPPASTRSLSELGFPDAQLPQIEMPDRPVNQNGCKGASLQFDFAGTATGGSP
jgi:hypothetical protein